MKINIVFSANLICSHTFLDGIFELESQNHRQSNSPTTQTQTIQQTDYLRIKNTQKTSTHHLITTNACKLDLYCVFWLGTGKEE